MNVSAFENTYMSTAFEHNIYILSMMFQHQVYNWHIMFQHFAHNISLIMFHAIAQCIVFLNTASSQHNLAHFGIPYLSL